MTLLQNILPIQLTARPGTYAQLVQKVLGVRQNWTKTSDSNRENGKSLPTKETKYIANAKEDSTHMFFNRQILPNERVPQSVKSMFPPLHSFRSTQTGRKLLQNIKVSAEQMKDSLMLMLLLAISWACFILLQIPA